MVDQNLNKQRANEIFQNIFEEAFLTNNGNPISVEMTKEGFKKHMGDVLSPDDIEEIEKIFVNADENNVSDLKTKKLTLYTCLGWESHKSRDQEVYNESSNRRAL